MTSLSDMERESADAEARIVRYGDLAPCYDAFIDTRTPGSDQKENFTIIGPGVSENPNQHVHIAEPHGFNIGGARQPPGCVNSQHSHETVEVFYVHSGRWRFMSGETGQDGAVELGPGDLISIPTHVFRGFENVGEETGFLWAILGGDDPGRVLWAPYVFDMAREHGLVLMADGALIDTAKGETVPAGKHPMPVTTREQVAALKRADNAQMEAIVIRDGAETPAGPFDGREGTGERYLIPAGGIDWPHGFTVSELHLAPGAQIPAHRIAAPDVWFVQSGKIRCELNGDPAICGPGDTVTVPQGGLRALQATQDGPARLVLVRSGDQSPGIEWATGDDG